MRRIRARAGADAAQLKEELAGLLAPESVVTQNGDVFVDVPEGVDEVQVVRVMQRHFPKGLLRELIDAFNAVDFQTPTTFAGLKPELQKHLAACKLLGKALKARWEG